MKKNIFLLMSLILIPGVLAETFFSTSSFIISVIIIILTFSIIFYFLFFFKTHKLKKQINLLEKKLPTESMETLKPIYVKLYDLYLGLTGSDKASFYSRVNKLRDVLEEHLRSEKELELLLTDINSGSVTEQKNKLSKIQKVFETLPLKSQSKYEQRIKQLKNRLELGHPVPKIALNQSNSMPNPPGI